VSARDPVNERDPVFARLAELPVSTLPEELGVRIRRLARARLVPRRLSPWFVLVVAASVVGYLGWALVFTAGLLAAR
jgi:hypothetical protein